MRRRAAAFVANLEPTRWGWRATVHRVPEGAGITVPLERLPSAWRRTRLAAEKWARRTIRHMAAADAKERDRRAGGRRLEFADDGSQLWDPGDV